MKLLVVFNTCGLNRENPVQYKEHINSILSQDFPNGEFHVVLSSCMNSAGCMWYLQDHFKNRISYNQIKTKVPVSVSFNDTVEKCIKSMGRFDGYMFVDSGILFQEPDVLSRLCELHESGPYAMTAARTDHDMGLDAWFGTDVRGDTLFSNGHMVVPVGRSVNLHVQIFSDELVQAYNRPLPDIFAGQCMESTFSFLCAALKKKWVVHKDIVVHHKTGMDGPSSGFSPLQWVASGKQRWDHLFVTEESILEIINRGYQYGMGYEELYSIVVHSDDCYDENGYCSNDNLKDYIRDNLYLCDKFDYSTLNTNFTFKVD